MKGTLAVMASNTNKKANPSKPNNTAKKKNGKKDSSMSVGVIIAIVALVVAVVLIVVGIIAMNKEKSDGTDSSAAASTASEASREIVSADPSEPSGYVEELDIGEFDDRCSYVQLEMDDGGRIVLELYPEVAPITVNNFMKLVGEGFYDGLTFHRISKGFVIQGGDPLGTGMGGSDETIFGEFTSNGFENNLSHDRGVISMARESGNNDSASSQFFIVLSGNHKTTLDGNYASFGKVIAGMDVVDTIAAVDVVKEKPLDPIVIKKATILHTAGENKDKE